ncbi:hypothetical protein [Aquimarina aggregata]|uniref:hypothetical protein n=1 Tax=Aquimarina aggregata TaxID=1642818 RepID=UPI00248FE91E|nr:hypothetical protein [Aquimarina aggregata]
MKIKTLYLFLIFNTILFSQEYKKDIVIVSIDSVDHILQYQKGHLDSLSYYYVKEKTRGSNFIGFELQELNPIDTEVLRNKEIIPFTKMYNDYKSQRLGKIGLNFMQFFGQPKKMVFVKKNNLKITYYKANTVLVHMSIRMSDEELKTRIDTNKNLISLRSLSDDLKYALTYLTADRIQTFKDAKSNYFVNTYHIPSDRYINLEKSDTSIHKSFYYFAIFSNDLVPHRATKLYKTKDLILPRIEGFKEFRDGNGFLVKLSSISAVKDDSSKNEVIQNIKMRDTILLKLSKY